jgi:Mrp family chromosome partitioning ATPase
MSRNFELLQQIGKKQDLFQTPAVASGALKTEYEATPTIEIAFPKPTLEPKPKLEPKSRPEAEAQEATKQVPRPELAKEKAKSWGQEVPRIKAPHNSEWAKTTRREELKLVQRIFPSSGLQGTQRGPQVVIFAGVEDGHAAPTICARSCEILAKRGDGPVCAVDANLESPFLHRYFGLANENGLLQALCDSRPVNEFAQKTTDSNLWVMTTGGANAKFDLSARRSERLPEQLKERMNELRTFFKYVVIHSPAHSDRAAAPPSFDADGLVLIVEANSTRREIVREVMEELRVLGTPILGVVLNNRTFPIPDAIYHKL